jgi:hypothetical protein
VVGFVGDYEGWGRRHEIGSEDEIILGLGDVSIHRGD